MLGKSKLNHAKSQGEAIRDVHRRQRARQKRAQVMGHSLNKDDKARVGKDQ